MKYIWQNYRAEKFFRVETKPLSPYLEVGNVGEKIIGVNPILRFEKIFSPLFEDDPPKDFRALENCLLHYLARLDLKAGVHCVSIHEHRLDREIREKFFGERVTEIYLSLTEDERRIFLIYLRRHEAAQGLKNFFFDAVQIFFPATKFYFHEWSKKFSLCIPAADSDHNKNLLSLLIFFLLDMGVAYEIFWGAHFGVIGDDSTIRIDDFIIY